MEKPKISIQKDPATNAAIVQIVKEITENTKFDQLDSSLLVGSKMLIIDFDKVSYINSSGIKLWIHWSKSITEKNPQLSFVYKNCPKVVIDQINYIGQFMVPGTVIESMYVPFYDKDKDRIENILLLRGKDFQEATDTAKEFVKVPELKSKDGTELEMDVSPEIYFKFLKSKK